MHRMALGSDAPSERGACLRLPNTLALTANAMSGAASNGTVIVTFTNKLQAAFAINWAKRLQAVGLRSLVGLSELTALTAFSELSSAGSTCFCAENAGLMSANGQAGRWAEAIPVLRLARKLSLSVLISDSDIAWIRNPLPYFAAAHASHPRLDLLMMTDRAFNNYEWRPLSVQPPRRNADASKTSSVDLELEPGYESSISYNIGVIYFFRHALRLHEAMITRWVSAVGGSGGVKAGGGKAGGKKLATWDQEPINKQVLQVGLSRDAQDPRLVRVDSGKLVMGVLPMLQFTTSFTYYMHRKRRESLRARPYCLHAIFAHGKDAERKMSIFREEGLWHDPPRYYELPPRSAGFLVAESLSIPPSLRAMGGFDMIRLQLQQVHALFHLARLLNRTLILPRLRCGERPMAYPCYAWYHRAMAYFGLNTDKVPMPEHCPMYYWLDAHQLRALPVQTREPSFLQNPRTSGAIKASVARLRLCAPGAPCAPGEADGREPTVHVKHKAPPGEIVSVLRGAAAGRAAVIRVHHVQWLSQVFHDTTSPFAESLYSSTRGFWCTGCPVTRRGAVISELNSTEVREIENFCKTEARGRLGLGPPMRSCCPHGQKLPCHTCSSMERRPVNVSQLKWPYDQWIPLYARLDLPAGAGEGGVWPECRHPLCTGANRLRFP